MKRKVSYRGEFEFSLSDRDEPVIISVEKATIKYPTSFPPETYEDSIREEEIVFYVFDKNNKEVIDYPSRDVDNITDKIIKKMEK